MAATVQQPLFQSTAAALSLITLPQDGDNKQQSEKKIDIDLGKKVELLSPRNITINNANNSENQHIQPPEAYRPVRIYGFCGLHTNESISDTMAHISGEIVFGQDASPFSGATAYVRVEDVSLQDAPSKVISEQIIRNVSYNPLNPQMIKFELEVDITDNQARYAVSVHIDVDGNGKINPGDLINMESYPVITQGYPNTVVIHARPIK